MTLAVVKSKGVKGHIHAKLRRPERHIRNHIVTQSSHFHGGPKLISTLTCPTVCKRFSKRRLFSSRPVNLVLQHKVWKSNQITAYVLRAHIAPQEPRGAKIPQGRRPCNFNSANPAARSAHDQQGDPTDLVAWRSIGSLFETIPAADTTPMNPGVCVGMIPLLSSETIKSTS